MYYLDTNICIYLLNGKFESVRDKLLELQPEQIRIPSMVKGELLTGAMKSRNRKQTTKQLDIFLDAFEIEAFDDEASEVYGNIRGELEKKGKIIGPADLVIAATVLSNNGILVTNNEKEFCRVSGLRTENWVNP